MVPCCDQHIVTAKKPKQPIEKSIDSRGLLALFVTQKYCDALPLYRQSEIFKRLGIQPLINLLQDPLLERPLIHMDETTVQVLNEPNKTAQRKSYRWLMASFTDKPITVFHYEPSRGQSIPQQLLSTEVKASTSPSSERSKDKRFKMWLIQR
jgi:transposase